MCFEWEVFYFRSDCEEEGCVPTMELDHSKRYSLEEEINLIVSSPNTIAPSIADTAHPITESQIDFVTDASGTATKANDDPLESSTSEENSDNEEENLNFFPLNCAIDTMFTDASTLIQNVDDLFNPTFDKSGSTEHPPASTSCDTMELDEKPTSTSCDKGTMTDCEFNPVAGIAQVPHKQISSTMMESESSCDEPKLQSRKWGWKFWRWWWWRGEDWARTGWTWTGGRRSKRTAGKKEEAQLAGTKRKNKGKAFNTTKTQL